MVYINNIHRKTLGNKGEMLVLDKLKTVGYHLHKKNFCRWGLEVDLILYKYNPDINHLEIRVVEVKTRSFYEFNLINLNILSKWRRLLKYLFVIKQEVIDSLCTEKGMQVNVSDIHFDVALVKNNPVSDETRLYSYIKDVNLMI